MNSTREKMYSMCPKQPTGARIQYTKTWSIREALKKSRGDLKERLWINPTKIPPDKGGSNNIEQDRNIWWYHSISTT